MKAAQLLGTWVKATLRTTRNQPDHKGIALQPAGLIVGIRVLDVLTHLFVEQ